MWLSLDLVIIDLVSEQMLQAILAMDLGLSITSTGTFSNRGIWWHVLADIKSRDVGFNIPIAVQQLTVCPRFPGLLQ